MQLHRTLLLLSLGWAALAASAGTVSVSFTQPERFSDAGNTPREAQQNLAALSRHLQYLAAQLPANQALKVEVLDLDLAGEVSPRRITTPLRIARSADFPRIHLRYALEQDGQVLRSGDEWLRDLDYSRHNRLSSYRNTDLYYEKRMLGAWFQQRIAPAM